MKIWKQNQSAKLESIAKSDPKFGCFSISYEIFFIKKFQKCFLVTRGSLPLRPLR
jgi:hypothetical protein